MSITDNYSNPSKTSSEIKYKSEPGSNLNTSRSESDSRPSNSPNTISIELSRDQKNELIAIGLKYAVEESLRRNERQLIPNHQTQCEVARPVAKSQCNDNDTEYPCLLSVMAYILDIYLELKVKDWGRAMVDPKRTRSYGVFCGKRLCVKSLVEAITGVIPDSDITDMKGTVRKHVGRSIVAIMNGSIGLADFSTREQKYAYRTLYGLCVTTINTKSTVELTTVTRGSSSSRAEKSAVLFQQTAPLPPGLTKEDFVHCLEVCWEERKESSPLRKN